MQQQKQPSATHISMPYMALLLLHHDESADAVAGIVDTSAERVGGAFDSIADSYGITPSAFPYHLHFLPKLDAATSSQFPAISISSFAYLLYSSQQLSIHLFDQ